MKVNEQEAKLSLG